MSNAEKELEGKLAEVAERLMDPPSDVKELVLLLDKTEMLLSKVEQSPSESMSAALHPTMKVLVSKELFGHPDADVRLALTACLSEITRVTAPDAPYDDDSMKEIFQMIVQAFENLNDVSSSSHSRRVSILETVAKVRSCVLMLDLECNELILEMFRHFLGKIRDNHSEKVFSAMEVIMTLVLVESEEISQELLSLFLTSVKMDNADVQPAARRLAESVIVNCSDKLQSCLMDAVRSLGVPLSDYSSVVASVCGANSTALEGSKLDPSAECLVSIAPKTITRRLENLEKDMEEIKGQLQRLLESESRRRQIPEMEKSIEGLEKQMEGLNQGVAQILRQPHQEKGQIPTIKRVDSQDPRHIRSGNQRQQVEMPLFDGDKPHEWICRAELYFAAMQLSEAEILNDVVALLHGSALTWFFFMETRFPFESWKDMKNKLLQRFADFNTRSLCSYLMSMKQEGSVAEYRRDLLLISQFAEGLDEELLEAIFVNGLRPNIREEVKLCKLTGLREIMNRAQLVEKTFKW